MFSGPRWSITWFYRVFCCWSVPLVPPHTNHEASILYCFFLPSFTRRYRDFFCQSVKVLPILFTGFFKSFFFCICCRWKWRPKERKCRNRPRKKKGQPFFFKNFFVLERSRVVKKNPTAKQKSNSAKRLSGARATFSPRAVFFITFFKKMLWTKIKHFGCCSCCCCCCCCCGLNSHAGRKAVAVYFFFVLLYFTCFFFIENNNNSNRRNVSLFSLQRSFSLVGLRAISRPVNRSRIERYAVPVPFHNWVQWWQWKRLRSTFFFVSTVVRRNVSSSSAGNSFHRSSVTCCLVFFCCCC